MLVQKRFLRQSISSLNKNRKHNEVARVFAPRSTNRVRPVPLVRSQLAAPNTSSSKRISPAHPHTPSLQPCLGTFQPEFGPRALPPHVPARARKGSPARATLSMPSYPRHRASNFRSHTSTHPTRVHGGCGALPSVSRLSSPNHQTFAFPPHRSEQAPKASRRQRRSTRHIRASSRGFHHHGGIHGTC